MNLFNKLFKNQLGNDNVFPKEGDDGIVTIENDKIICVGNHGVYSCEVNLNDLQYAYIVIGQNNLVSLFLFDYHQNYIPVNYKGFKKVYETLSSRFKFDDVAFFENINKKEKFKKVIWRKQQSPTYQILTTSYNDYAVGFEIQSPRKQFINWNTTYNELEKSEHVFFQKSSYNQNILKFKYPIRISNILLNDFGYYFDNKRKDVAVLNLYTHCFDNQGTDRSYDDLKETLKRDLNFDDKNYGYERDDQKNIHFDFKGINLSICYTYDSDWQFNGGYTSLSIENRREYPELLMDIDYEKRLIISEALVFEKNVRTPTDYKRHVRIKRRPKKISEVFNESAVIWVDGQNEKIGFSSNEFAQVFNTDEIESFCVQNVLPAKGSGGAYLEIVPNNGNHNYAVFNQACSFFDAYAEQIEKLTGKKVVFAEAYHDC
jgi:hypothetical protein